MAQARDSTRGGLASFPRRRERRVGGPLLALVGLLALPAEAVGDGAASVPTQQMQTATVAPAPAPRSDPPAQSAATPKEVEFGPSDEGRRRALLLLLMRSAGPIRPYGNFGH